MTCNCAADLSSSCSVGGLGPPLKTSVVGEDCEIRASFPLFGSWRRALGSFWKVQGNGEAEVTEKEG